MGAAWVIENKSTESVFGVSIDLMNIFDMKLYYLNLINELCYQNSLIGFNRFGSPLFYRKFWGFGANKKERINERRKNLWQKVFLRF